MHAWIRINGLSGNLHLSRAYPLRYLSLLHVPKLYFSFLRSWHLKNLIFEINFDWHFVLRGLCDRSVSAHRSPDGKQLLTRATPANFYALVTFNRLSPIGPPVPSLLGETLASLLWDCRYLHWSSLAMHSETLLLSFQPIEMMWAMFCHESSSWNIKVKILID